MKWLELILSEPSTLTFGNGSFATISWRRELKRGELEDSANVVFSSGNALQLVGAADAGETVRAPRIFVIYGRRPEAALLLGGPTMYRLNSRGHVEESFPLYREVADAEYWTTQLAETPAGLLVVYESGLLLIDEDLDVVWQQKKYFSDFFGGVEGNSLYLLRDHEEKLALSLEDGGPA